MRRAVICRALANDRSMVMNACMSLPKSQHTRPPCVKVPRCPAPCRGSRLHHIAHAPFPSEPAPEPSCVLKGVPFVAPSLDHHRQQCTPLLTALKMSQTLFIHACVRAHTRSHTVAHTHTAESVHRRSAMAAAAAIPAARLARPMPGQLTVPVAWNACTFPKSSVLIRFSVSLIGATRRR